jgi:nucleotide-binding universal stress UspA family protein
MSRIIVGVDGSPASVEAVKWAIGEATRRDATVTALHAWHDVYTAGAPYTVAVTPTDYAKAGGRVLDRAIAEAGPEPVDVEIRRVVVREGPAIALLDAATPDDIIVVGSRGRGGFAGLLLGSVSQQVVHHARCPVVVIPAGWSA